MAVKKNLEVANTSVEFGFEHMGIGTTKMSMPIRVDYLGGFIGNRGGVRKSGTQTGKGRAV